MSICPVCSDTVHADEAAFAHHVNSHFENGESSRNGLNGNKRHPSQDSSRSTHKYSRLDEPHEDSSLECFICGYPLSELNEQAKESHVNGCLASVDGSERDFDYTKADNGQAKDSDWVAVEWDGPAKPGGWTDWVNKKVERGDQWFTEGDRSNLPSNFTPNVIPVLQALLQASSKKNVTRQAVLSRPIYHIKGGWSFDWGWGCGYRNALMAISAMIQLPQYQKVFARSENGADPGVRRVQGWIEEAWAEGFDQEGKQQLKGKVLGTRKWIGTTDLYAMFTYKGIPCQLRSCFTSCSPQDHVLIPLNSGDFPKARKGSDAYSPSLSLQSWVKEYFQSGINTSTRSPKPTNALEAMMSNSHNQSSNIHISHKLPVILQHSGHSRTIIGYEETRQGVNLLVLDPGRTTPKEIRGAAIESMSSTQPTRPRQSSMNSMNSGTSIPKPPKLSHHSSSHESIQFDIPYSNGASETAPLGLQEEVVESPMADQDESSNDGGWIKRTLTKKRSKGESGPSVSVDAAVKKALEKVTVPKALSCFRVSLSNLAQHPEYQILHFTGGPLLTAQERRQRMVVSSSRAGP